MRGVMLWCHDILCRIELCTWLGSKVHNLMRRLWRELVGEIRVRQHHLDL